jgi:hypothetical protein
MKRILVAVVLALLTTGVLAAGVASAADIKPWHPIRTAADIKPW